MSELAGPVGGRTLVGGPSDAAREVLIGTSIAGRYTLRALIGQGGMGAVYEAEHVGIGKRVAIKFIDPEFATDEGVVARFAREARVMSAIESAHIVSVLDAGTDSGRPYLVMELLRGEDLGQRLRRTRRVPLGESMHIVAQVLKGLSKAHAAGIVHRDLKPDNVFLVRSDTDPLFAKIVDFGVSKIERPRNKTSPLALTGRGTVLGTPFYMSPEQAQASSDVDPRADLYSVGAILFECLSGRPPHTGETYEQIILSICMSDAPNLRAIEPGLPPEVAAFVGKSLSRDRSQRFASAERMLAALHEIAPEEKVRVPLDVGPAQTLLSAGMTSRDAPRSEGQEAPATVVSPPPTMDPGATNVALEAAGLAPRKKRSSTPLLLTAVIATLTGVVAMTVVIGVVGGSKTSATPTASATASVSSTATAAASASTPASAASASPVVSSSAAPPASASAGLHASSPTAKPGRSGAAAKPAPKLDISRDLP
jgi:serine/threonine-protein kinase